MIVCAVPVKDLVNAKQRLIKALAPDERTALAQQAGGAVGVLGQ